MTGHLLQFLLAAVDRVGCVDRTAVGHTLIFASLPAEAGISALYVQSNAQNKYAVTLQ